jgi:hypothetical protein
MNLINITIDEQAIELDPDFNIRFTFNSPLPSKQAIPVSSTYWFTFPASDNNNVILNHANNTYVSSRLKSYNCRMMVSGLFFSGKLYVKNAGAKEYKAFAVFNDLFETLIDKNVSDIVNDIHVLGTDTDTVIAAAKLMSQGAYIK